MRETLCTGHTRLDTNSVTSWHDSGNGENTTGFWVQLHRTLQMFGNSYWGALAPRSHCCPNPPRVTLLRTHPVAFKTGTLED